MKLYTQIILILIERSDSEAIFENDVDENTLLRPFADNSSDSIAGNPMIRWANILKYIGGNKREVQLTRNVSNLIFMIVTLSIMEI